MIRQSRFSSQRPCGQTAVEYMLLLGVVVAIVLVAFKVYLPRAKNSANIYFNRTSLRIMGDPNPCGDGCCDMPFEDVDKCPVDCLSGGSCP